jgi:putative transport protein
LVISLGYAVVLAAFLIGLWLTPTPFDDLVGTIAEVTGNPAILAYASQAVPTNKPELGDAIAFPSSTIFTIIIVQILMAVFPG